jgi:hypothetical protein
MTGKQEVSSSATTTPTTSETPAATTGESSPLRGRPAEVSPAVRGRARDHAPSKHRSRSRSELRKPKSAASKLKGMVKSGWNSMRKNLSSKSSTGSDVASRASTDNGSLAAISVNQTSATASEKETEPVKSTAAGAAATTDKMTAKALSASLDGDDTALELVVLLMDPVSRRFELLQLEFDSSRAKVSDLLTQIPLSVTEKVLQEQTYVGVMDENAQVQEGSVRLLEAFGKLPKIEKDSTKAKKMVLVAKPMGISARETMRLAKPILTDAQVAIMVRMQICSGISKG